MCNNVVNVVDAHVHEPKVCTRLTSAKDSPKSGLQTCFPDLHGIRDPDVGASMVFYLHPVLRTLAVTCDTLAVTLNNASQRAVLLQMSSRCFALGMAPKQNLCDEQSPISSLQLVSLDSTAVYGGVSLLVITVWNA